MIINDPQNLKILIGFTGVIVFAVIYIVLKPKRGVPKLWNSRGSQLNAGVYDEEARKEVAADAKIEQEDLDGSDRFYFPIVKGDSYAIASVKFDGCGFRTNFVIDGSDKLTSFSFSINGPRMAYLSGEEIIRVINMKSGSNSLVLNQDNCNLLKISREGRFLAALTVKSEPTISIYSADSSNLILSIDPSTNPFSEAETTVNDFDFSSDSKFIYYSVSAIDDSVHFITKFDLESREIANIIKIKNRATCMSISADDNKLAFIMSSSDFVSLNVFDLLDFDSPIQIQTGKGGIEMGSAFLRWTEDGNYIFNYGKKNELFLIRLVEEGMMIKQLQTDDSSDIIVSFQ